MGNTNPRCHWPRCECATESGNPCKVEDPDFYINRARKQATPTTVKGRDWLLSLGRVVVEGDPINDVDIVIDNFDEAARRAREVAAEHDGYRQAFAHEFDRLQFEGEGQLAYDLRKAFATIPDVVVLRIGRRIRNRKP